jgi:hypothetical protein
LSSIWTGTRASLSPKEEPLEVRLSSLSKNVRLESLTYFGLEA